MKSTTNVKYTDFEQKLLDYFRSVRRSEILFNHWGSIGTEVRVAELPPAVLITKVGGEDEGTEYYKIWEFTDPETKQKVLVKFEGWYASYDGSTFEESYIVTSQPVEVLQFTRKG